jgi:hypothetical protein
MVSMLLYLPIDLQHQHTPAADLSHLILAPRDFPTLFNLSNVNF